MEWKTTTLYMNSTVKKKYIVHEYIKCICMFLALIIGVGFIIKVFPYLYIVLLNEKKETVKFTIVLILEVFVLYFMMYFIYDKIKTIKSIINGNMEYTSVIFERIYYRNRKASSSVHVVKCIDGKEIEMDWNTDVAFLEKGDEIYLVRIKNSQDTQYLIETEEFLTLQNIRKNKVGWEQTLVGLKCSFGLSILAIILLLIVFWGRWSKDANIKIAMLVFLGIIMLTSITVYFILKKYVSKKWNLKLLQQIIRFHLLQNSLEI